MHRKDVRTPDTDELLTSFKQTPGPEKDAPLQGDVSVTGRLASSPASPLSPALAGAPAWALPEEMTSPGTKDTLRVSSLAWPAELELCPGLH